MNIEFRDASYRSQPFGGGKLIRRVEARCGNLRAMGANRTEAKAELLAAVERQLEHAYTRRYLGAGDVVFVLYYADGWAYEIVVAGTVRCTTGFSSASSEHEALESMRRHFEQYTEAAA